MRRIISLVFVLFILLLLAFVAVVFRQHGNIVINNTGDCVQINTGNHNRINLNCGQGHLVPDYYPSMNMAKDVPSVLPYRLKSASVVMLPNQPALFPIQPESTSEREYPMTQNNGRSIHNNSGNWLPVGNTSNPQPITTFYPPAQPVNGPYTPTSPVSNGPLPPTSPINDCIEPSVVVVSVLALLVIGFLLYRRKRHG